MKRKFIDVRTTNENGEIVDVLCINHAAPEQLMSLLTLVPACYEVLIVFREEEVTMPFKPSNQGE